MKNQFECAKLLCLTVKRCKMAAKKRKFSEDYIKFGFTFIEKDELQLPQSVICMKVLKVRWLSKGNMLARLYELQEEVIIFLEFKEKHDLLTMFKDDTFQCMLAYLNDLFGALNELNLKIQGRNDTIISNYDYIQRFIAKLQLWNKKLSSENVISFSRLFEAIKNNKLDANLKADIKTHLQALEDEFRRYYRDIDSESPIWHMTRNPYVVDMLQLPEEVQEEFLEMKADSSMKDDFHLLTWRNFGSKDCLLIRNLPLLLYEY
ncbi:unnamed protein product [Parnassius apollo]|uniref:(apollo) hypothetical protein n=1 Tax=Parnassius apollo TaxID=110799 RepID=A0A8S3Y5S6_PARAO|nr:unnamed protein product [Parnassius apollo]